jgi:hypothetical protein
VIGPIGDKLAPLNTEARRLYEDSIEVFEQIIEPACEACGLTAIRSDRLRRSGEIPEQVYVRLRDCPLVIADVTGGNPNVFYELGLRHSVQLPSIQIGEKARLPFDVNVIRTVFFTRTESGMIAARKELTEMIKAALIGDYDPSTATRVFMRTEGAPPGELATATAVDAAVRVEDDEPGFVDYLAEGETALPVLVQILEASATQMAEITRVTEAATEKTVRATSFGARLVIVKEYARALAEPANELDDLSARYSEAFASVERSNDYLIGRAEEDPATYKEAPDFYTSLKFLATATQESAASLQAYIGSLRENAQMAKDLRPPARKIEHALQRYLDAAEVSGPWLQRIEAIEASLDT